MNENQIIERIKEIIKDDRFTCTTATVFENAPLALIQWGLETELHTLERVLGIELTDVKELRKEH